MSLVVVTGGAGFLGSHLCEALIARGDGVLCVDDLSSGRVENLKGLVGKARFEFVCADVCEGLEVTNHVDAVLHLASPASPPDYLARPLETLAAGSRGTDAALWLAHEHGARFVMGSTSEIYGDPLVHPQAESYWGNVNPIGPRSVYNEAKRYAEALTAAYRRACEMNTGIIRIFNTYGPRLRPGDGRVISNFVTQALSGKPLTVYGDGNQTRSLCYVDDLIRGIVYMLDSDVPGPVNLGNPAEITVLDLAALVLEMTESRSMITNLPLPDDDPVRRRPDISLAKKLLDWTPVTELRVGLARTVEWFRAEIASGESSERTG
jgi:dTDP-glucose 4,6-dehydratase